MVLSVPKPLHAEGSFGKSLHGKWKAIAVTGVFLGAATLADNSVPQGTPQGPCCTLTLCFFLWSLQQPCALFFWFTAEDVSAGLEPRVIQPALSPGFPSLHFFLLSPVPS